MQLKNFAEQDEVLIPEHEIVSISGSQEIFSKGNFHIIENFPTKLWSVSTYLMFTYDPLHSKRTRVNIYSLTVPNEISGTVGGLSVYLSSSITSTAWTTLRNNVINYQLPRWQLTNYFNSVTSFSKISELSFSGKKFWINYSDTTDSPLVTENKMTK